MSLSILSALLLASTPPTLLQERAMPPLRELVEAEPIPLSFPAPAYRRDSRFLGEAALLHRESRAFTASPDFGADELELSPAEAEARLQAIYPRAVRLEYTLSAKGTGRELLTGSDLVQPGHPVAFTDFEERSYVVDMDVEIAQATAIADPIVEPLATGAGLVLQLDPVGDGSYQLEWLVRRLATEGDEPIDLGTRFGGLVRTDGLHGSAAGVSRLRPGTPWTTAFTGTDGETCELRLVLEATSPAAAPGLCYLPTLPPRAEGFRARRRSPGPDASARGRRRARGHRARARRV